MSGVKRLVAALAAVLAISGCGVSGNGDSGGQDGVLSVLTTTGMIADTVKNVGGERVSVTALMGPGVDPHLYKASAGDITRLNRAEAVFYNGLFLEGKMVDVLEKIARGKPTFAVGDALSHDTLLFSAQFGEHPDPHIWFDVALWSKTIDFVAARLTEIDPDGAAHFAANAASYKQTLEELDEYARSRVTEIPEEQRILVTAHDAFSYFGRAYGIRVVGLQGINTSSEYGIADVQRLVNIIVESNVKAVFIESSVPRRSIEAVVQGVRARGGEVSIGGQLFSDAMGESGTPKGTYPGMVRHNVDTIVDSLK